MLHEEPVIPMRVVPPPRPTVSTTYPAMSLDTAVRVLREQQAKPEYWCASLVGPSESVVLTIVMLEELKPGE